jgi:hypothetical protein
MSRVQKMGKIGPLGFERGSSADIANSAFSTQILPLFYSYGNFDLA